MTLQEISPCDKHAAQMAELFKVAGLDALVPQTPEEAEERLAMALSGHKRERAYYDPTAHIMMMCVSLIAVGIKNGAGTMESLAGCPFCRDKHLLPILVGRALETYEELDPPVTH